MDYSVILNKVKNFLTEKGDGVAKHWGELEVVDIHNDGIDVTTNFDRKIEKEFSDFVLKNFPDHGFKGEEFADLRNEDAEFVWYIDPIDGTKFFAKGVPFWTVTAALVKNGEPVLGIIYDPINKFLYEAYEGGGAYVNGKKLTFNPKEIDDLSKHQISLEFITWKYDWETMQNKLMSITSELNMRAYRVRMLGNGSLSLAWLSQGLFGAHIDPYRPVDKLIDNMAGFVIAKEAGAVVDISYVTENMVQVIVSSPGMINQIKDIIRLDV